MRERSLSPEPAQTKRQTPSTPTPILSTRYTPEEMDKAPELENKKHFLNVFNLNHVSQEQRIGVCAHTHMHTFCVSVFLCLMILYASWRRQTLTILYLIFWLYLYLLFFFFAFVEVYELKNSALCFTIPEKEKVVNLLDAIKKKTVTLDTLRYATYSPCSSPPTAASGRTCTQSSHTVFFLCKHQCLWAQVFILGKSLFELFNLL